MTKVIDTERRLVAIFAADVEGYSRLMGADEVGTMRNLTQRRTILDALIASHRGRIANTAGDSVLAEFGSAVDAVQCAVEAQAALAEANAALSQDYHINFRIGVHVGDVMIKGGDLFGDGVNIAARLQTLASAGGISISGVAHDQVRKILPFVFTDLGAQQVKNIEEPVRTFAVTTKGASPILASSNASVPLALPDKPSIAVLPFQNMSGDPEQEYFADGMVEDIITALSRFKSLFVIARNSSFIYKGKAVDIKQVGQELGVRYVLEGSVRKASGRVRITGQLIDATTGAHLWADRFDGSLEDIFDLQDQVTTKVVGAIAPKLERAEMERAKRKPTEKFDAYDCLQRGIAYFDIRTKVSTKEALTLFYRAIQIDPDFATPYAFAAGCFSHRNANGWVENKSHEDAETRRLALRAISLGQDDPLALCWAGFALGHVLHELETAAAVVDQSLTINSNSAVAWFVRAYVSLWNGEPDRTVSEVTHSMRFNPLDPGIFRPETLLANAHLFLGHFEEASAWAERAMIRQPQWGPTVRVAVASSALAGKTDVMKRALFLLGEIDPGFRILEFEQRAIYRRKSDMAMFLEGFRKAGLPE